MQHTANRATGGPGSPPAPAATTDLRAAARAARGRFRPRRQVRPHADAVSAPACRSRATRACNSATHPSGHKHFEGDERTPEGRYLIDYRNPRSAYHLSLHISYPGADDRAYAAAHGRSPGGEIFIHGQPNALTEGREPGDWTDGCIAVSNAEIEELWREVPDGTPIEIRP